MQKRAAHRSLRQPAEAGLQAADSEWQDAVTESESEREVDWNRNLNFRKFASSD
jgi:hypothetical protein